MMSPMDITRKFAAELNIDDTMLIIDEVVRVVKITPDFMNGRIRVDFTYDDKAPSTAMSWLLFKPSDRVITGLPMVNLYVTGV